MMASYGGRIGNNRIIHHTIGFVRISFFFLLTQFSWPITVFGFTLPDARVGDPYHYAIGYQGLVEPVRAIWEGLPKWLKADGATIYGTPPTAFNRPIEFTVELEGQLKKRLKETCYLSVHPRPVPLALISNPTLYVPLGEDVVIPIPAIGGEGKYRWEHEWITKMKGLRINIDNDSGACWLVGRALSRGEFKLQTTVRDEFGGSATQTYTGIVSNFAVDLKIVSEDLPVAIVGQPYSSTLIPEGGRPPYTWGISWTGHTPEGLSFDSATGHFEGKLWKEGKYKLSVNLIDASGSKSSKSIAMEARQPERLPTLKLEQPQKGTVGVPFKVRLSLDSDGIEPKWEIKGAPSWLKWQKADKATCIFSGEPTESGNWTIEADASITKSRPESRNASYTVSRTFTIIIEKEKVQPLSIASSAPLLAFQGAAFSYRFLTTGGKPPVIYSCDKKLPTWMQMSKDGLLVSDHILENGTHKFEVIATSADGQTVRQPTELLAIGAHQKPLLEVLTPRDISVPLLQYTPFSIPIRGGIPPYKIKFDAPSGVQVLQPESASSVSYLRLNYPWAARHPLKIQVNDSSGEAVSNIINLRMMASPSLVFILVGGILIAVIIYIFITSSHRE